MKVASLALLAATAPAFLARASNAKDARSVLDEIQARKAARKTKQGGNGARQRSLFSKFKAKDADAAKEKPRGSFARRGDAARALQEGDVLPDELMSMAEMRGPGVQMGGDPDPTDFLPPYPMGDPAKLCPAPGGWMGPPPPEWGGAPPPPEWQGPHPPPEWQAPHPPPPPPGWTPWNRKLNKSGKTSKSYKSYYGDDYKSSSKSGKGWRSDGPRAKADEPEKCAPVGKECQGYAYYKLGYILEEGKNDEIDEERSSWTDLAMLAGDPDATTYPAGGLEHCTLAPIPSLEEFTNLLLRANQLANELIDIGDLEFDPFLYLGVVKKPTDVLKDNMGHGSRNNWYNLDGTPAAVCDALWAQIQVGQDEFLEQPENDSLGLTFGNINLPETRIALVIAGENGLADIPDAAFISALGLYKCCGGSITFSSCAATA